jgi:CubicO group peptidase (beta-lactamase class C family)
MKNINFLNFCLFLLLTFQISHTAFSQQSKTNMSGFNSIEMGEHEKFSTCQKYSDLALKKNCRVGILSQSDKVLINMRTIDASKKPLNLNFSKNTPQKIFNKVDEYISKYPIMGFLVIKNGEIVVERFQYGRDQNMIFRGMSMSKTVTSILTGIAHSKGLIQSLDDKVEKYWPEIKKSPYGAVTIKELLLMTSGVEGGSYNGFTASTGSGIFRELFGSKNPNNLIEYLNNINPNGIKGNFRYSNQDTEVLGRILCKITKKNISQLTSEWLWQPMGAKKNAKWWFSNTDKLELASTGITATLHDYGRLGILLSNNGKYKNNQIIPEDFLVEATSVNKIPLSNHKVGSNPLSAGGYGYQVWLQSNKNRTFCLLGHYGQVICVQPSSKIVMVQVAAGGHEFYQKGVFSLSYLWNDILEILGRTQ